jgi:hypothetical protein
MKHTPGPWKITTIADYTFIGEVDNTRDGQGICEMMGECEANAKLIAAAPELLSALKRLELASAMVALVDNSEENLEAVELRAALNMSIKAIEKAEGENQ